MNLTLQLLKVIFSPFEEITEISSLESKWSELYYHSIKNRMSLLYLEALKKNHRLGTLKSIYEQESITYLKTLDAIARCSQILSDADIEHVIFKTIRPYISTTVDIDILILEDKSNYTKSTKTMQKAGYELIVCGPRSTTLRDPETNMGIDLYEQVAVSYLTYMDKGKLIDYVILERLPNGEFVKTLMPEADLAAIIAHSIIKEQMYTLSEYYTFIRYLKQMSIHNFIQIVKQNNITSATRRHTAITALLHYAAHKTVPHELQQILAHLGEETFETIRLVKNDFKTPHKYHLLTVAKSLLETAKGEKSRSSIATQIFHMLNPNFTKKFLKASTQYITRETY